MRRSGWILIAIAALLLALGGCAEKKGSDGSNGAAGAAGAIGAPGAPGAPGTDFAPETAAEACAACHGDGQYADVAVGIFHGVAPLAAISPVDFDTEVTAVDVSAANEITVTVKVTLAGTATAVTNLISSGVRFTLAKFVPVATNSGVAEWVSYFKSTAGLATYQTTSASGGVFTNLTGGSYSYKFSDGAATGAAPKLFPGTDVGATLRVATQISVSTTAGSVPYPYGGRSITNGWFDFVLATNAAQVATAKGPLNATGTPTNHVVDMANCNECHQTLAMHGGGRRNLEYCETCHNGGNGGTAYANKDSLGTSIDFKQMLHKVHYGKLLPSVADGALDYGIVGYSGTLISFKESLFPQTMTNCEKCHGNATGKSYTTAGGTVIAGLATLDNWKSVASVEACTSCHDGTVFDAALVSGYKTLHLGGAQTDLTAANCQNCHNATVSTTDKKKVQNAHGWGQQLTEAATWNFNITSASYSSTSKKVTVVFKIENPVSTATDFTTGAGAIPWQASGGDSKLVLNIATKARGGADYTNDATSDGTTPGSPLSYNLLGTLPTGATLANASNTFTFVSEDISAKVGAAGTGMAFVDGHPAKSIGGFTRRIPVLSGIKEFRIGDTPSTGIPRRAVVDTAKCNECHGDTRYPGVGLSLHDESRNVDGTSGIRVCVACHNSANTDIATHVVAGDGLTEQAIDMKFMIHRIHKGGELESGAFQVGEEEFGGEFPPGRMLNNCQNCHFAAPATIPAYAGGGTFGMDANQLPLAAGIEGTTVDSGTSLTSHTDDLNISPNSATCSGCHDSDGAKNHMTLMGGNFAVKQADIEFY